MGANRFLTRKTFSTLSPNQICLTTQLVCSLFFCGTLLSMAFSTTHGLPQCKCGANHLEQVDHHDAKDWTYCRSHLLKLAQTRLHLLGWLTHTCSTCSLTLAQLIRTTRSRLFELTCTCSTDPLTLVHTCSTDSLTPTQLTHSHLLKPASTARWFSKPVRLLSLSFLVVD